MPAPVSLRTRLAVCAVLAAFVPVVPLVAVLVVVSGGSLDAYEWAVAAVAWLLAAVVVLVGVRGYVHRELTGPLDALTRAARALSADERVRLAPVQADGAPEVLRLADAFDGVLDRVAGYVTELERNRTEFRAALERLGDVLASTHDREAIIDVALQTSTVLVGAREAVFYRAAGRQLVARATTTTAIGLGTRLEAGAGVAGGAIARGAAAVHPGDVVAPDPAEPPAEAALAVPLHTEGGLYGVLAVYGRAAGGRFSADDVEGLRAFARQTEAAIENTFLHEEASRLSITDGLTGVWNRRFFDMQCAQELERADRFGEPFSLVMCDVDDFKAVNDVLGHQTGDAVLVELARRLTDATREVDRVARFGGEEFAVLLPRTDLDGALQLAEKVRSSVADEPVVTDAGAVRTAVSLGVATYPLHAATVRRLVAAADAALYRAKAAGKNRLEAASPPDTPPPAVTGATSAPSLEASP